MDREKTVSQTIAEYALNMTIRDVPDDVIQHAKLLLLDTFGVAMACQKMDHANAIKKAVIDMGSSEQCTLWGTDKKVQLADAILYNACLIHGDDYDDTHVASIVHPSASVVSTAMAVGEYVGSSGQEILEAIIMGWEVIIRLGLAAKGRFHDAGYHATGIVSPFACVCVASKLMRHPKSVVVNALGICGSQSAAIQEFLNDGTGTKKMHPGWGGHSAIYAIAMAKAGFTGPEEVFEGRYGMWQTHFGVRDGFKESLRDFGDVYHTKDITFKMYPVCHMTHSFIDCIIKLKKENYLIESEIKEIECRIEPRCFHIVCEPQEAKKRPVSEYMMKFSLPYVAAIAFIKERVSPWEIDEKLAASDEITSMIDRVICHSDETKSNPGYFPGYVKITTYAGKVYERTQLTELGTRENPIEFGQVIKKFEDNLSVFYGNEQIKELTNAIRNIANSKNNSEIISLLKPECK